MSLVGLTLSACAPMTGGPMPIPLAAGTTSSVELSLASARAPEVRELPEFEDPPLPNVQIQATSAFSLTSRVEAGPSFLLDVGPRAVPGAVSGGLFVRVWVTDPDARLLAGVRASAGWAWGGLGTDLAFAISDDTALTLAPTVQLTPQMVAGRLPVGAVLRLEPLSVGLEAGVTGAIGFTSGARSAPWVAVRIRAEL